MKEVILKGRIAKTYNGIKTQLDKALRKLYTEEEIDNLSFYVDIEDNKDFYIWDYTEDRDSSICMRYHLMYERATGMVYRKEIGVEAK